jgi:hypothetical protein
MSEGVKVLLKSAKVLIDYTNYRGERSLRPIYPMMIFYGTTEYHKEPGYLLEALDLDKLNEEGKPQLRFFAMKDIHSWTEEASRGD